MSKKMLQRYTETCPLVVERDGVGVEYTVQFTRVVEWFYDPAYGADADGNRGIGVWLFEEEAPEDLVFHDEEGAREVPIPPDLMEKAREAVYDFCSKNTPENQGEDDSYEPDCDPE